MKGVQLTLRELLTRLTDPVMLLLAAAATGFAVVAGPYGTGALPLGVRAVYWAGSIAVACVLSTALIVGAIVSPRLAHLGEAARAGLGVGAFCLVYPLFLWVWSGVILPDAGRAPGYFGFLMFTAPVAVVITGVVLLVRARTGAGEAADAPAAPRLLKRLPPALNAPLIRLRMQDHYVEVVTARGSDLVLMRFADAIEETAPTQGWRVHRSHWVAEAAIDGVERANGKTLLVMADGDKVPVSRTYAPALREAGLFSRFR